MSRSEQVASENAADRVAIYERLKYLGESWECSLLQNRIFGIVTRFFRRWKQAKRRRIVNLYACIPGGSARW